MNASGPLARLCPAKLVARSRRWITTCTQRGQSDVGSSATKVQQVRIPGRIPESARSGSQATQRATMAYLRRGCFTIDTGSMSTVRKRGNNGDKKKGREKERTQKGKREKEEKKRRRVRKSGRDRFSSSGRTTFDIHVNCYVIYSLADARGRMRVCQKKYKVTPATAFIKDFKTSCLWLYIFLQLFFVVLIHPHVCPRCPNVFTSQYLSIVKGVCY